MQGEQEEQEEQEEEQEEQDDRRGRGLGELGAPGVELVLVRRAANRRDAVGLAQPGVIRAI